MSNQVATTPEIVTFAADPLAITAGESSMLTWLVVGAETCTIEPNAGEVPLEGAVTVVPEQTTVYTLIAVGSGSEVSAAVEVEVRS